jgi:chemotaxis protein CheZ
MSEQDSPELEALFDSIASQYQSKAEAGTPATVPAAPDKPEDIHTSLGHMLRNLHDTLRGLGYDKALEKVVSAIPDAQDRLTYVATMTEQAAVRVLNATEKAQPIQDKIEAESIRLAGQWDALFQNQLGVEEFKQLVLGTRSFLSDLPKQTQATNAQLMEIMMAQDFQDLTGQVIKKVVEMVQNIEGQLLQVLIEVMPEDKKAAAPEGLMNGPVISAAGRSDVLTSQAQVDDLLESLGF